MKTNVVILRILVPILLLALAGCTGEQAVEKKAPEPPAEKAAAEGRCTMCGMDTTISKGRFILDFEDGTRVEACAGRCAATLTRKQASKLYKVQVYGYDLDKLIDGRKAVYVLGASRIPEGSMAPPVFAFSTGEAADSFIAESGGRRATLDDVLALRPPKKGHGEAMQ
jgi:nitrous oxide reductase accessory protein NosL